MSRYANALLMFGPGHGSTMLVLMEDAYERHRHHGGLGDPTRRPGDVTMRSLWETSHRQTLSQPLKELLWTGPYEMNSAIDMFPNGSPMSIQRLTVHSYYRAENFTNDNCEDVWLYVHDDRCCEQGMK